MRTWSMLLTCCALHNLCESHGEAYDVLDAAAAQTVVVMVAQDVEEEGKDIRGSECLNVNVSRG